jgi:hypothetical protein
VPEIILNEEIGTVNEVKVKPKDHYYSNEEYNYIFDYYTNNAFNYDLSYYYVCKQDYLDTIIKTSEMIKEINSYDNNNQWNANNKFEKIMTFIETSSHSSSESFLLAYFILFEPLDYLNFDINNVDTEGDFRYDYCYKLKAISFLNNMSDGAYYYAAMQLSNHLSDLDNNNNGNNDNNNNNNNNNNSKVNNFTLFVLDFDYESYQVEEDVVIKKFFSIINDESVSYTIRISAATDHLLYTNNNEGFNTGPHRNVIIDIIITIINKSSEELEKLTLITDYNCENYSNKWDKKVFALIRLLSVAYYLMEDSNNNDIELGGGRA